MLRGVVVFLFCSCVSGLAIAHPGGVDEDGCHKDLRTDTRHCHLERAKHAKKKPAYDHEHPPKPGDEGVFYGQVIAIVDGDTFSVKVQGVVMKFRLQGVDTPEPDQPYGASASAVLSEIIRGHDLVLVFDDVDAYGRIVAQAWVGKLEINEEMVRRGAAWFESEYAHDDRLYWVEQDARKRKAGLWALPAKDRVELWVWRERIREQGGHRADR